MTDKNYTISMMFRETTHWNVYSRADAVHLVQYVAQRAASGDEHYARLETALLAQSCTLNDQETATPLKIVARLDAYRKKLKAEGKEPDAEYAETLRIAFKGHRRATNGLEIRDAKLRALGVERSNG